MTATNSIIRMNQLSRELQKHGFAVNSQDGMEKAREIYNNSDIQITDAEARNVGNDEFTGKIEALHRFKQATEERISHLESSIKVLLEKTNEIIKEINDLQKFKNMAVGDQKEVQTRIPEQKKEPHPKQGNFKSEDVAIDKIFYYGEK